MAIKSNTNFLNFTKLTYAEILRQVNDRLKEDPKFENFRETAIAQIIVEIFSGMADFNNYMIERRAEEQFFETAQLKSSIISLSKNLSYVPQRPVPASTALSVTIKGPLPSGLQVGDQITIQKGDVNFLHQGINYIAPKTYVYTFTSNDITNGVGNNSFLKVVDGAVTSLGTVTLNEQGNIPTSAIEDIRIIQGTLTVSEFLATDPGSRKGKTFQKYKVNDVTFSNIYGSEDYSYDQTTETFQLEEGFTKVGIGIDQNTAFQETNLYEIDRRSILTSETVLDSISLSGSSIPKVCLATSNLDQTVNIEFADNIVANIGPITVNDNLYVQYISTIGANANQVGVVGDKITSDTTFLTSISNTNLTNNLIFKLAKNITGGADFESIDSIKFNAPGVYQSLDRIVTAKDYIAFLKSQTTPINIKNAIAWGEQEEVEKAKALGESIIAQKKLFNVVLYSVLGELYYFSTNYNAGVRTLSGSDVNTDLTNAVLEGDSYSEFSKQDFFNILVAGTSSDESGVIDQLGTVQSTSASNVSTLTNKIDKKSQITVRNIYLSPIIQHFTLTGNVYVKNLSNLNDTKKRVNYAIYKFLNEDIDFEQPVYISNLVEIIENDTSVIYTDASITPVGYTTADAIVGGALSADPNVVNSNTVDTSAAIISYMESEISDYIQGIDNIDASYYRTGLATALSSNNLDIKENDQIVLGEEPWQKAIVTDERSHFRQKNFSARTFYTGLMKNIWSGMSNETFYGDYRNTTDFQAIMLKLSNELKETIRSGMLDSKGNIVNYSLANEVSQIEIQLTYRYRS